jgi:hypothetical protein
MTGAVRAGVLSDGRRRSRFKHQQIRRKVSFVIGISVDSVIVPKHRAM